MKNYYIKPYDVGYEAPATMDMVARQAVLEMGERGEDILLAPQSVGVPLHVTLGLEMRLQYYDGPVTLERFVNGKSGGITSLYQPGNVLLDGSQNLKPLSKVRSVEFVYQGRGAYVDEYDLSRPFYEGHGLNYLIQLVSGEVVFQKPFAGRAANLRLETQTNRHDRDEWTEVMGFGRDTYPLYPYGGYVPPYGDLREIEQVYAFVGADPNAGGMVTALRLHRSSFFHTSAGFPPTPFRYDRKNWVFPQSVSHVEQMTVGQALAEGLLTFKIKDETGDLYSYKSYAYEQPGASMTQVNVHCLRN